MKATEQYFPVVLFIMLYKVVLTFGCPGEYSEEIGYLCYFVFLPRRMAFF